MKRKVITLLFFIVTLISSAQYSSLNFGSTSKWKAQWISVPETDGQRAGVYLFRKTFELDSVPEKYTIQVSADNRYKLFVNEKLVSLGPVLSDVWHWNYETVDLAPYLKEGKNIIAAKVWNGGDLKPESQISVQTGFFLQGVESDEINSNESWKCIEDKSYSFVLPNIETTYYAGPDEKVEMKLRPKEWKKLLFNDDSWLTASPVNLGKTGSTLSGTTGKNWQLVESILPPMELSVQRLIKLRRTEGIELKTNFPAQKDAVKIPSNSKVKLLLDQSFLTNAYPTLIFSNGENSTIKITYAESLFKEKNTKNNRNEIEGKNISGANDVIISDGTPDQEFTSLSYRTYRYVELQVETQDEPLVIEDFYGVFTGYPFENKAQLKTDNQELNKILEIGWRTARLCAVETYMDCPYYERLNYIGDSRIQMLVSYYNSGDDRLAKHTLNLMDYSRQSDGFTLSRYPTNLLQVIPPYSLWYISTLHDYLMYGNDPDFVKDKIPGVRQILNYFIAYQQEDGSLKKVPGWNFTDWANGFMIGIGPTGSDGCSAVMDLQLLLAFQSAIKLEQYAGKKEIVNLYKNLEEQLTNTIKGKYWDSSRHLFADTSDKTRFSQHANSLAILAGLVSGEEATQVGYQMLSDSTLTQASIYFKYYLHQALSKAGLEDQYLNWLDIWRKNINLGLTTWGETSDVETTRSDCHAWGSSPNIEFFRILLGIDSNAPGFSKIRIEPHLGDIKKIEGTMPHPNGEISVSYEKTGDGLKAIIQLPVKTSGDFIWEGKNYSLHAGQNKIETTNRR